MGARIFDIWETVEDKEVKRYTVYSRNQQGKTAGGGAVIIEYLYDSKPADTSLHWQHVVPM